MNKRIRKKLDKRVHHKHWRDYHRMIFRQVLDDAKRIIISAYQNEGESRQYVYLKLSHNRSFKHKQIVDTMSYEKACRWLKCRNGKYHGSLLDDERFDRVWVNETEEQLFTQLRETSEKICKQFMWAGGLNTSHMDLKKYKGGKLSNEP